jgi:hypothetical protein
MSREISHNLSVANKCALQYIAKITKLLKKKKYYSLVRLSIMNYQLESAAT